MNTDKETIRLYYTDSHLNTFNAQVLSCIQQEDHYEIILNQTAFFPEGGGQTSDIGVLILPESGTRIEVYDVQEKGNVILHYTKEAVQQGSMVQGAIDYERRFQFMQQHSGEHIVSGIVHSLYGYDNVGFHLGSDSVTMDFNGMLTPEDIVKIESLANEAVYKNVPILETYPSSQELEAMTYRSKKELSGQVRIVTIPYSVDRDGTLSNELYDRCACCAPHVYRTGEIGTIKLVSAAKYKGGMRVSMVCGHRALADYRIKETNCYEISVLLSAKPYEVAKAVSQMQQDMASLRGRIAELEQQIIGYKVKEIADGTQNLCLFEEHMDASKLRPYCNALMEKCTGVVAVFTGDDSTGYKYVIGSKTSDVRELGNKLKEQFQSQVGGSKEMIQGSLIGIKEEIQQILLV